MDDKRVVAIKSLKKCTVENETPHKKHVKTTHNVINLLNEVPNAHLQTLGVKDRTAIIVWAKKIIGKHDHLKNVQ